MIALSSYLKTRIALMSGRMTSLSAQSSAPARRVESGKWPWICSKRCLRRGKMLHHAALGSYSINSILYSMFTSDNNKVLLAWMVQVAAFHHARLRWLWAQWRWAPRSRPVKGWDNGSWRYISSSRIALASAVLGSWDIRFPGTKGRYPPLGLTVDHGIPWHTMAQGGKVDAILANSAIAAAEKGGRWDLVSGLSWAIYEGKWGISAFFGLPMGDPILDKFGHHICETFFIDAIIEALELLGDWAEEAKENGVWAAFWEKESGNVGPAA